MITHFYVPYLTPETGVVAVLILHTSLKVDQGLSFIRSADGLSWQLLDNLPWQPQMISFQVGVTLKSIHVWQREGFGRKNAQTWEVDFYSPTG